MNPSPHFLSGNFRPASVPLSCRAFLPIHNRLDTQRVRRDETPSREAAELSRKAVKVSRKDAELSREAAEGSRNVADTFLSLAGRFSWEVYSFPFGSALSLCQAQRFLMSADMSLGPA
jgi:hypothetical protein